MAKVQPRTLSGFMELLPAQQIQFDRMAAIVRQNLDMDAVYKIIRGEDVPCGRWADA